MLAEQMGFAALGFVASLLWITGVTLRRLRHIASGAAIILCAMVVGVCVEGTTTALNIAGMLLLGLGSITLVLHMLMSVFGKSGDKNVLWSGVLALLIGLLGVLAI